MSVTDYIIFFGSIGSALLVIWSIVQKISAPIHALVKRSDLSEQSSLMLMRHHIKEMCDKPLRRGWIWSEEIDDINEMFELYNSRGGNGSAKSRVARCRNLEIRHHTEPWEVERLR